MQVYRGLSIATAKATKDERSQATHHMLDVATPNEPFTVTHFRDLALPIVSISFHVKSLFPPLLLCLLLTLLFMKEKRKYNNFMGLILHNSRNRRREISSFYCQQTNRFLLADSRRELETSFNCHRMIYF